MLRNLLVCGLLAGVVAGVLVTGFASLTGEPSIDRAIALEDAQSHSDGPAEPEVVSRGIQKSLGLTTAVVVFALSVGGLFALAFAVIYGRFAQGSPQRTALWLAAIAFVTVFLVPFLKYPSMPPAASNAETIGDRTSLYVLMVALSVGLAAAVAWLRGNAMSRLSSHAATGVAIGTYLAGIVAIALAMPGVNELPRDFPAATLWEFRVSTVGIHAVMWAAIGSVFAVTSSRVMTGRKIVPSVTELRAALVAR